MAEELNRIMSTLVEAVTCTGNHHPCTGHVSWASKLLAPCRMKVLAHSCGVLAAQRHLQKHAHCRHRIQMYNLSSDIQNLQGLPHMDCCRSARKCLRASPGAARPAEAGQG